MMRRLKTQSSRTKGDCHALRARNDNSALWLVFVMIMILFITGNARLLHAVSGADYLFTRIDARSAMLGGMTGGLFADILSADQNPASLAGLKERGLAVANFSDLTLNLMSGAVVFSMFELPVRVGVTALQQNDLKYVAFNTGENQYQPTGETFGYAGYAASISSGIKLDSRLSVGVTVRQIMEELEAHSASGTAIDAGLILKPAEFLFVGLSLENAWTSDIRWNTESQARSSLHKRWVIAGGLSLLNDSLRVVLARRFIEETKRPTFHGGIEARLTPAFLLGAGYDNGTVSVGAGLWLSLCWLDYAMSIPLEAEQDIFGQTSRVTVRIPL